MAKLYGSLQGNRGEATKCGSRASGIKASVQSWNGSLIAYMDLDDNDKPIIELRITEGSNSYGGHISFRGTLEELKKKLEG
ncbi:MAG: hypothetical protein IKF82_01460 [Bacilli bacterium]|nr:hypothetical protein [Bacilli bacterium]